MRNKTRTNRPKSKPSWRKASGDDKLYFMAHNIVSMLLFFWASMEMRLFEQQTYNLIEIFSFDFLQFFGVIIGLTILFALSSRIIVYGIFWVINHYQNTKSEGMRITTIKSFWNMNQGINEFATYHYIKIMFWSSLAFCVGVVVILQITLFKSESLWSLIGAYIIIKLLIYGYFWIKDK